MISIAISHLWRIGINLNPREYSRVQRLFIYPGAYESPQLKHSGPPPPHARKFA